MHRIVVLAISTLALSILVPTASFAAEAETEPEAEATAGEGAAGAEAAAGEEVPLEETPLYVAMEAMNDHYRGIGRGLRRPDPAQQDVYLEHIDALIRLSQECIQYVPERAEGLAGEEREAFIAGYVAKMEATVVTLQAMREAVVAGEYETADGLFDDLKAHKAEGHRDYQIEE